MRIAVDFDGVICDPKNVSPGKRMGNPVYGCKEAMDRLRSEGHEIVIYTVRATVGRDMQYLRDWLDFFAVPYDDIAVAKPNCDVYLDDRAVRFTDWESAMGEML